ncbi:hypothetical protein CH373_07250 [Leptospira perolatii]|uniref:Uncharacterized protein n=1 Tax=Leptospira perolatii TaxID=2023191 RepID=A0A2M9ZPJ1_9LEPT|nr:hypothetical protein [Leptospira perolatii]PJZ70716.1 hypothetical protein CH360_04110 [Leptospira perolatii]PJZ73925.1 hypothetical protein CH373_07250 [Leptospira perolatii]
MTNSEPEKAGYPFHPLQDFILGEILAKTLEKFGIPKEEIDSAIRSNLKPGQKEFICTPNAKKQILLQTVPVEIRGLLQADKTSEVVEVFHNIIAQDGRLDFALELIEWIFTGFENEDLVRKLFEQVLNHKIVLPVEFYSFLKKEYETEMLGDLDLGNKKE